MEKTDKNNETSQLLIKKTISMPPSENKKRIKKPSKDFAFCKKKGMNNEIMKEFVESFFDKAMKTLDFSSKVELLTKKLDLRSTAEFKELYIEYFLWMTGGRTSFNNEEFSRSIQEHVYTINLVLRENFNFFEEHKECEFKDQLLQISDILIKRIDSPLAEGYQVDNQDTLNIVYTLVGRVDTAEFLNNYYINDTQDTINARKALCDSTGETNTALRSRSNNITGLDASIAIFGTAACLMLLYAIIKFAKFIYKKSTKKSVIEYERIELK